MSLPSDLPANFSHTRNSLHQLAEHVISAARYQHEKRIGLRATTNGFGTPDNSDWQVRVEGTDLVVKREGQESRKTITTLEVAAKFVGCDLGAPSNVYKPTTTCDPNLELNLDSAATAFLAQWTTFANQQLVDLREALNSTDSSEIQLWPEHFDLSLEDGNESAGLRAGYGASPGDEHYDQPYFYVVPWQLQGPTEIWNARGFSGHVTTWSNLSQAGDPAELIRTRFVMAREAIESQK